MNNEITLKSFCSYLICIWFRLKPNVLKRMLLTGLFFALWWTLYLFTLVVCFYLDYEDVLKYHSHMLAITIEGNRVSFSISNIINSSAFWTQHPSSQVHKNSICKSKPSAIPGTIFSGHDFPLSFMHLLFCEKIMLPSSLAKGILA